MVWTTLLFGALLASGSPHLPSSASPSGGSADQPAPDPFGTVQSPAVPRAGSNEIVVIGPRDRGSVLGNIAPIRQVGATEIQSYGTGNVGGLVEALEPQTRSNRGGGDRQLILLNGARIADFSEISSIPVEAVERVDILPEEVALSYGYPVGARVLNVVLRSSFRAATTDEDVTLATRGGREGVSADWSVTRIRRDERVILDLSAGGESELLETERDLIAPRPDRSLLAQTRRFTVGGSIAGNLSRVSGSLSGRLSRSDSDARLGRVSGGRLDRETGSESGRIGATLAGDFGLWRWSTTAAAERARTDVQDSIGGAFAGRTRYRADRAAADVSLNGPFARLPAGDAILSLTLRLESFAFASTLPSGHTSLDRTAATMLANLDLPLLVRASPIGQLGLGVSFAGRRLSRFGWLPTLGASLRWSPIAPLSVTLGWIDDDGAPSLQDLGEPIVATPSVLVFDPARDETVAVTLLHGGNPALRRNNRRERKVELVLRPAAVPNLVVSANYSEVDLANPIATFPIISPTLESAFPGRFVRDSSGRLILVDARSISVASSVFRGVRWGASWSTERRGQGRPPRRIQLSLYDTWRFRNAILTSPGGPILDLLNGSSIGSRGGLSRHLLEAQASFLFGAFGARIDATWQAPTIVRAGGPGTRGLDDLYFASHSLVGARLFLSLSQSRAFAGLPDPIRRGRITLAIDNLLDRRLSVQDRQGITPLGYQPAFLDPLGRTVRVFFRTTF